ncbi:MAG TPA: IS1 family transposase [Gemmataceae bacterium]|jgi:transposase-like protein/IS1 family transposase
MLCPYCEGSARRFGFNRNGSQRYRCDACRVTFTDDATRPADRRRLAFDRAVFCLRLLLEGTSIRSVERLTGIHRDTILTAFVDVGERCQRFLEEMIRDVPVEDVQADEIWAFVGCKEKTRERNNYAEYFGDAYCFTAIERSTKVIIAWHLGKRSPEDTWLFAEKLSRATNGRFQLTTDGFTPYRTAIPNTLGTRVDFAQLVKVYGFPDGDERRYSPPQVVSAIPTTRTGNPIAERICTSHVERSNLTIRMTVRRLTRLTNAFSKKWENHEAALALFFAFYNFCRPHMTLTEEMGYKCSPAMRAGLTDHVWDLPELMELAASA